MAKQWLAKSMDAEAGPPASPSSAILYSVISDMSLNLDGPQFFFTDEMVLIELLGG